MIAIKNIFVIPILSLVFLGACSDNPVSDDEHGHEDVAGLALSIGGEEIVVVSDATVTGKITVLEGQESGEITVEWRDSDGAHLHDEDLDDHLSLGAVVENEAVAEFDQHTGQPRWEFNIHAGDKGTTTLELQLFNVDHVDFRTPPIEITIK
jgi:hypothetical protein